MPFSSPKDKLEASVMGAHTGFEDEEMKKERYDYI